MDLLSKTTMKRLWEAYDLDLNPADPDHFYDKRRQPSSQTRSLDIHSHDASSYREWTVMILQHAQVLAVQMGRVGWECNLIEMAKRRRADSPVISMERAIKAADLEVNKGLNHSKDKRDDEAIFSLAKALCILMPWSADRTWMSFEQARMSGLPQLEYQILSSIARVGLGAVQYTVNGDCVTGARSRFGVLILPALSAANLLPFATWKEMRDIVERARQPTERSQGLTIIVMWWRWKQGRDKDLGGMATAQWATRRIAAERFERIDSAAWVHANCDITHTCQEPINLLSDGPGCLPLYIDVNHPAIRRPFLELCLSDPQRQLDGPNGHMRATITPDTCCPTFLMTPLSGGIYTPLQQHQFGPTPEPTVRFSTLAPIESRSPLSVQPVNHSTNFLKPHDKASSSRKRKQQDAGAGNEVAKKKAAKAWRKGQTCST